MRTREGSATDPTLRVPQSFPLIVALVAIVGCAAQRPATPSAELADSRGPAPDRERSALSNLSPLHQAAAAGDVERARQLITSGAAIDARDAQGQTPLDLAVAANRPSVVTLLIARGASPVPSGASAPLYVSAARGNREMVDAIAVAADGLEAGRAGVVTGIVDAAMSAGGRVGSWEKAYGATFSRATFHMLVAKEYSRAERRGLARAYYTDAASSYEAASLELATRGQQAATDQRRREFYAALANAILPVLAGAAAQAQAETMARQTGSFGVGVVSYPTVNVNPGGDYGAQYGRMSRTSYFSALQTYLIIQCYDEAVSGGDKAKCREIETLVEVK